MLNVLTSSGSSCIARLDSEVFAFGLGDMFDLQSMLKKSLHIAMNFECLDSLFWACDKTCTWTRCEFSPEQENWCLWQMVTTKGITWYDAYLTIYSERKRKFPLFRAYDIVSLSALGRTRKIDLNRFAVSLSVTKVKLRMWHHAVSLYTLKCKLQVPSNQNQIFQIWTALRSMRSNCMMQ